MGMSGCYVMYFYCNNELPDLFVDDSVGNKAIIKHDNHCWEYLGHTASEARKEARKEGWKINMQTGECVCPWCN